MGRGEPRSIIPTLDSFVRSAERYEHATLEPYRELRDIAGSIEAETGPIGDVEMTERARDVDEFVRIAELLDTIQALEAKQSPPGVAEPDQIADGLSAEVHLDADAAVSECLAVRDAFSEVGVEVEVSADSEAREATSLPWTLVAELAVPLGVFFTAFAAQSGKRASDDAYDALKRLVAKLFAARVTSRHPVGKVRLRGDDGVLVSLEDHLPSEALHQLLSETLPSSPSGFLLYDRIAGRWRDAWDV